MKGGPRSSSGEERRMKLLGFLVTVCGWLLAATSVMWTSSLFGQLMLALLGIAVCLVGILALLNTAEAKEAIWK